MPLFVPIRDCSFERTDINRNVTRMKLGFSWFVCKSASHVFDIPWVLNCFCNCFSLSFEKQVIEGPCSHEMHESVAARSRSFLKAHEGNLQLTSGVLRVGEDFVRGFENLFELVGPHEQGLTVPSCVVTFCFTCYPGIYAQGTIRSQPGAPLPSPSLS